MIIYVEFILKLFLLLLIMMSLSPKDKDAGTVGLQLILSALAIYTWGM